MVYLDAKISAKARYFLFLFWGRYGEECVEKSIPDLCLELFLNNRMVVGCLEELIDLDVLVHEVSLKKFGRPIHMYRLTTEYCSILGDEKFKRVDVSSCARAFRTGQVVSRQADWQEQYVADGAPLRRRRWILDLNARILLLTLIFASDRDGALKNIGSSTLMKWTGFSAVSVQRAIAKLSELKVVIQVIRGGAVQGFGKVKSIYKVSGDWMQLVRDDYVATDIFDGNLVGDNGYLDYLSDFIMPMVFNHVLWKNQHSIIKEAMIKCVVAPEQCGLTADKFLEFLGALATGRQERREFMVPLLKYYGHHIMKLIKGEMSGFRWPPYGHALKEFIETRDMRLAEIFCSITVSPTLNDFWNRYDLSEDFKLFFYAAILYSDIAFADDCRRAKY